MSLETILAKSRLMLGDLAVVKWSEQELVLHANEGKNELVKIIMGVNENYFETTATGSFSATTAPNPTDITLPDDFVRLKNIRITSSGYEDIEFIHMDHSDARFDSALRSGGDAYPGYFYWDILAERTLRLAPGSGIALAYAIDYIKTIVDMSLLSDGPTGIPREHWDWLVTYTVVQALRTRGDERLLGYERKLTEQTNRVVDCVAQRHHKEAEYVVGFLEDEGW